MKTNDVIKGIVIECYDHDSHRVVVAQTNDAPGEYSFFYIPQTPEVNFGDIIQLNPAEGEFYVYRGNGRLTFKINPTAFPGGLLWELISERLSE